MPTQQVITANRLDDGRVVFIGDDNRWITDLQSARVLTDGADAALAAVDATSVVEAYLIDVERVASSLQPVLIRERIRANGPSVGLPGAPASFLRRAAA